MEDLLTSNVFGMFSYLEPHQGLLQFVETARSLGGVPLPRLAEVDTARFEFWRWLEKDGVCAQPDVLIEMKMTNGDRQVLLVESKYRSGKSSVVTTEETMLTDQLAREMFLLRAYAKESGKDYALLYVTAHTKMPKNEIHEAIDELEREEAGLPDGDKFYWTSWRELPRVLAPVIPSLDVLGGAMLSDLIIIIQRMELVYFSGIQSKGRWLGSDNWRFRKTPVQFKWQLDFETNYSFGRQGHEFT